jgi:glycosyltransferase involved in cell wall biosynthesis
MRIAIAQLFDENFFGRMKHCLSSVAHYCSDNNYEHIPMCGTLTDDCHINYQKTLLLLNEIDKYDYIVWMDADIFIANPKIKLEDIINKYPRDIYYCKDPNWELNSGVLIFKNSAKSKDILQKWWDKRLITTQGSFRDDLKADQGRLIDTLKENGSLDQLPYWLMNSHPSLYKPGDFIVHFMGYHPMDIYSHTEWCAKLRSKEELEEYIFAFGELAPDHLTRIKNKDYNLVPPKLLEKHIESSRGPKEISHSIIMISHLGEYPNCAKDRERKFGRAVDSFLANEYSAKELIIVSDGCEKTNSIYSSEYAHKENISLIIAPKQEPGYPGALRSIGLLLAKGKTISYLDSDDYIAPDFISRLMPHLWSKAAWCYYDAYTADINGDFPSVPEIPEQNAIEELRGFRWTNLPAIRRTRAIGSPNIAHTREVRENCRWKNWDGQGERSEDWDFVEQLIEKHGEGVKLSFAPGYYLCHFRPGGVDV